MAGDDRIDVQIGATADELQAGFDQAKSTVSDATAQMKADLDKLGQGSSGATSQIADSFKEMHGQITSQISQITTAISGLGAAFMGLGALLAGGALFKGAVDQYVNMILEAKKLSNQMGISVQDAAAIQHAYERMGVSSDTVSQALRMLERNIKTNGDAVVDMGRQVGVNIDLNAGLEAIYFKVTEALGKYEVGHQRNQAALAAFGARVQNINELLLVNRQNVADCVEHLRKLGIEMGENDVKKARDFKAGMADLNLEWDVLKYKVGEGVIPILMKLASLLEWVTTKIREMNVAWSGSEGSLAYLAKYGPDLGGRGTKGMGYGGEEGAGTRPPTGAKFTPLDKTKGGAGGGAPGLLAQWKEELEQLKTEQNAFLDFSKEKEKEFWEAKLALCAEGSKEYLAVSRELYAVNKALAQEGAKDHIAELDRQMTSEKTNWDARKSLMAEEVAYVKTTYGEKSSQYQAVLQKQAQFDQEYDKQQRTREQSRLDNELKLGQMRLDAAREEVKFKEQMGEISASAAAAQETALTNQSLAQEQRHIQQSKANWTGYYAELQKLAEKDAEFKEKKLIEVQKAEEQSALKNKATIQGMLAPIQTAIDGSVMGIIQGTTTMQKAVTNMCTAILSAFLGMLSKMVMNWMTNQIEMVVFGRTEQTAAAVGQITSDAAVAAAGAYAATAAIPIVGPAMAPAAGMEAYAAVMAYAAMASAEAGAWGIPRAGAALLHPGEAVLPASKAAGLDRLIEGGPAPGGGGANIHLNITAFDGADVQRVLLANPRALAAALTALGRNFVPV